MEAPPVIPQTIEAPPVIPQLPQPSSRRSFLSWLFSWPNIRRFLIGIVGLVTLLVLINSVESWRGARAWAQHKAELEARGEKLDLKDFIPPAVPDEQNFASTPLFKGFFEESGETNQIKGRAPAAHDQLPLMVTDSGDSRKRPAPPTGSLEKATLTDLAAWQAFYRGNTNYPQPVQPQSAAADVLLALSKFDPELKELQAAAGRPYARFPMRYLKGDPFSVLLPHLSAIRAPVKVLTLRAVAHMEAGMPQEALADLKLSFRLADSIKDEPLLISHLVRVAIETMTLQGVREGLARHAWGDGQLADLGKFLASVDLLSDYKQTMRGERAWCMAGLDYIQKVGWPKQDLLNDENPVGSHLLGSLPAGWMAQNKVTISRLHQDYTLTVVDEKARRVLPDRVAQMDEAFRKMRTGPYNVLAKLLVPAVSKVSLKTARTQVLVDEARLACALERHRLASGQFPDSLEALVPRFIERLPQDIMSGQPLKYDRTSDGGYRVYSVGWNQRDDGGKVAMKENSSSQVDIEQGDWVWKN